MLITPPSSVWGLSVSPLKGAAPTELDSVAVRLLEGQLARIRFLRWQLRDFELPNNRLNPDGNGWVLTLVIEVASSTVHLWQGDGVFYAPEGRPLRYIDAPEHGGPTHPRWHKKSGNLWPVLNSTRLPFRGQFRAAEYIGYVFGDVENSTLSVSLHQSGEQDVEDHYTSEE
jgi:hypothetical protein